MQLLQLFGDTPIVFSVGELGGLFQGAVVGFNGLVVIPLQYQAIAQVVEALRIITEGEILLGCGIVTGAIIGRAPPLGGS